MNLVDKLKAAALTLSIGVSSAGCFTPINQLPDTFPPKPRALQSFGGSHYYVVSPNAMNAYRSTMGLEAMPLCNRTSRDYCLPTEKADEVFKRCRYTLGMKEDQADEYRKVFSMPNTLTMTPDVFEYDTFVWAWPHEEFHRLEELLPQEKRQMLIDTHKKITDSGPIIYDPSCLKKPGDPNHKRDPSYQQHIGKTMTRSPYEFYAYLAQCPELAERYLALHPETHKIFNEVKSKTLPIHAIRLNWMNTWR